MVRYVLLPLIRSVLTDMFHMETALQGVHDLNWTVVRPPGLQNLPASGRNRRAIYRSIAIDVEL